MLGNVHEETGSDFKIFSLVSRCLFCFGTLITCYVSRKKHSFGYSMKLELDICFVTARSHAVAIT